MYLLHKFWENLKKLLKGFFVRKKIVKKSSHYFSNLNAWGCLTPDVRHESSSEVSGASNRFRHPLGACGIPAHHASALGCVFWSVIRVVSGFCSNLGCLTNVRQYCQTEVIVQKKLSTPFFHCIICFEKSMFGQKLLSSFEAEFSGSWQLKNTKYRCQTLGEHVRHSYRCRKKLQINVSDRAWGVDMSRYPVFCKPISSRKVIALERQ